MLQMARIVIGNAQSERMALVPGVPVRIGISEMSLHLARESRGPFGPLRIIAQQVTVLLHRRSATGRVDDDRVHIGRFEHCDHLLRQRSGIVFQPGVEHERAATLLARGE